MPKLKEAPQPVQAGDLRPGSNAMKMLVSFVERLERLDEERAGLVADMKEVREEAKGMGFDTKTIGKVLARRKLDSAVRQESDALLELYEDVIAQAEKDEFNQSLKHADEPAPKAAGWGNRAKQAQAAEPVQADIEDVTDEEAQAAAAQAIGHAADHPEKDGAPDVGNIPAFLRRQK